MRDTLAVLFIGALLTLALEGGVRLLGIGAPERPEFPPKQLGTFRILALGGSTVLGVPDGDLGFVAQLASRLPGLARGRAVQVLNLARSGAPSSQVRELLDASADAEPDLLIVLTGHNEFLAPRATQGLRGLLQRARDASQLVRALVGRSDDAAVAASGHYADPVPTIDPVARAEVSRSYHANLAAIVATAAARGVPLILCTAPSNLADWPPAHRHLATEPSQPDPPEALVYFRRGEVLRSEGRSDEARDQFALALEHDPVPRRAFQEFNDAVRAQASRPGVRVVDLAERFEAMAEQGLVGFELICDNCHPTPRGNALIAREIALAMADMGLLLDPKTGIGGVAEWLARAQRRIGGPEQQARAHLRWLLSNAIYAMKTPFFNFEAARDYLEQALALAPRDWRVHANLGTLSLLEGDDRAGRRALARATTLKGAPLDPSDRHLTPYLAEALAAGLSPPSAGGS